MSVFESMAEGFAAIERHPLSADYMQLALDEVRKLANVAGDDTRKDIVDFLKATEAIPGEAIAVLTPDSVSLLTGANGQLLEFA